MARQADNSRTPEWAKLSTTRKHQGGHGVENKNKMLEGGTKKKQRWRPRAVGGYLGTERRLRKLGIWHELEGKFQGVPQIAG